MNCIEIKLPCNEFECIALKIILADNNHNNNPFIVTGMYRPPNAKSIFYDQLNDILKHFNNCNEIILFGDLNVNWLYKTKRNDLKTIAGKYDLGQIIEGPTRLTKNESLIDLAFTNCPDCILKTYNLVTGLSS